MRFLRFLAAESVPVGVPVASVDGNYIEVLTGGYYASAQNEAPGALMERHLRDLSAYRAWGRSLGKLHAAARRYQPDPAIDFAFPAVQDFCRSIQATAQRIGRCFSAPARS